MMKASSIFLITAAAILSIVLIFGGVREANAIEVKGTMHTTTTAIGGGRFVVVQELGTGKILILYYQITIDELKLIDVTITDINDPITRQMVRQPGNINKR